MRVIQYTDTSRCSLHMYENLYIINKKFPSRNVLVLLYVASWYLWQVIVFHYQPFFTLAFWFYNCFWMHVMQCTFRALRLCSVSLKIRCASDQSRLNMNKTAKAVRQKISPCCLAYCFMWGVQLKTEPRCMAILTALHFLMIMYSKTPI